MSEQKEKLDYANFLEMVKKLNEEEKRKEEETNQKKIGDLTVGELKNLIRSTVKAEATTGDLPLLNNSRKKKLQKWTWISVAILLLSGIAYRSFWSESDFNLEINKDKLYVKKRIGWNVEKKEIKVLDDKWQLCSSYDGKEYCSPIFTPFEARYNDYYKFIFVGRGNVFWVKNDKTQITPVKFIDGSWSFKNDYDDDWTDFDSLYDYQEYEPVDPRY